MIDGDGDSVLAAAAAGLMDVGRLPVLFGADVAVSSSSRIVARCRHTLHRHGLQSQARAVELTARHRRCNQPVDSTIVLDDDQTHDSPSSTTSRRTP